MAPALLRGLSILGPADAPGPDIALEMGVSAWMLRAETDVAGVSRLLPALRAAVLDAAGMDATHEPVPFVGRSHRDDVLRSVAYLADLLERAAAAASCSAIEIAERAIDRLPRPPAPTAHEAPVAPVLAKIIPIRRPDR